MNPKDKNQKMTDYFEEVEELNVDFETDEENTSFNQNDEDHGDGDDVEVVLEDSDDSKTKDDEDGDGDKTKPKKSSRFNDRIRQLNAQKKQAEQAAREKEEKLKLLEAELAAQKKQTLKEKRERIETLKNTVEAQKKTYTEALKNIKERLKTAHENGDHATIVELQSELGEAQLSLRALESFKPEPIPVEDDEDDLNDVVDTIKKQQPKDQQRKAPKIEDLPEACQNWLENNPWFLDPEGREDLERVEEARLYSESLVRKGYDPDSEEFYEMVDNRLKKLGLAKEEEDDLQSEEYEASSNRSKDVKTQASRKKISQQVVRGSDRSSPRKNPNKVTLTPEEKQIADLMGIPYESYAKEKIKLEKAKSQGSSYVRIGK